MSRTAEYDFTASERCVVREVALSALEDSSNNHFHRMEGEKWDEFVGSIRDYGVLSPLLIRPKEDASGRYEILAGHNRRRAAAAAGLSTVPCITMDVDDVDASVLIGISNQQRESVSDLEWGWTYRTTLEALKQQHAAGCLQAAPGERSIDIVAQKYGVNRKTAQRKIRLTYLIPQLYRLGLERNFSQKMLVNLSYLPPVVQTNVVQAAVIENIVLTEHLTAALRTAASQRDLTISDVLEICRDLGNAEDPADRRRPVRYTVPDALFPKALQKKQRQNYIAAALSYIRDHGIELDMKLQDPPG